MSTQAAADKEPEVDVDELADVLSGKRTEEENAVEDKEDDSKPEAKEEAEETPPAAEGKEEAAKEGEKEDNLFDVEEQNRELRQLLRQQKREMAVLKAKLDRLEKRSAAATKEVEKNILEEEIYEKPDEKAAGPAEGVSQVEAIQAELAQIAKVKGPVLETLLEVMEANPKYADIRTVCSQAHFDDIFEAIGEAVAAKEGRDPAIAALEAEAAVWKMPNPYKYMYDLIKQYHPKYAGRQQQKSEGTAGKGKEAARKPVEAPSSIADKSGKSAPTNAWTAARIDEMDEMELDKVPPDIYEKYLRGELD